MIWYTKWEKRSNIKCKVCNNRGCIFERKLKLFGLITLKTQQECDLCIEKGHNANKWVKGKKKTYEDKVKNIKGIKGV
jgi:hypothetical protein